MGNFKKRLPYPLSQARDTHRNQLRSPISPSGHAAIRAIRPLVVKARCREISAIGLDEAAGQKDIRALKRLSVAGQEIQTCKGRSNDVNLDRSECLLAESIRLGPWYPFDRYRRTMHVRGFS